MRAHVIQGGIITNTIEVASLDFLPGLVDAGIGGVIGWAWNNGAPAPIPAPAGRCSVRCLECDALYKTKLASGLSYGGFTYQINDDAQNSIAKREAYAHLSSQDAVTYHWDGVYARGWWDTSNVYHAMTAAQFLAFAKAVSDYVSVRAACCRDHKNALIAIQDDGVKTDAQKVTDINAYNIQAGW